jgi:hypothetical protein
MCLLLQPVAAGRLMIHQAGRQLIDPIDFTIHDSALLGRRTYNPEAIGMQQVKQLRKILVRQESGLIHRLLCEPVPLRFLQHSPDTPASI